jgi:hypothetical protein
MFPVKKLLPVPPFPPPMGHMCGITSAISQFMLFIIQAYVIIAQSRDISGSGTLPQDEDILDGS